MTDFRVLCADLLAWAEKTSAHYYQQPDVLIRARAALAQPEPEVGPTDEELLDIAAQSIEPYDKIRPGEYEAENNCAIEVYSSELIAFARAVLARHGHQPTPPAEGEVAELVEWLRDRAESTSLAHNALRITRAAELLEQRHPAPVPVSEHPWKRDRWCDDEDRCWCFNQWDLQWELEYYTTGAHWCDWMLPATALPLPAGEVE